MAEATSFEGIQAEDDLIVLLGRSARRAYTKLELLTSLLGTQQGSRLRSDDAIAAVVMNVAARLELRLLGA
jgi:hypothetical protein